MKPGWHTQYLTTTASAWFTKIAKRTRPRVSENSLWWHFSFRWPQNKHDIIQRFIDAKHIFEPMVRFCFADESHLSWCYVDRLAIKLILNIIKPTFKHIISPRCYHLQGPQGVKLAIRDIERALKRNTFHYVMRLDIKSYYASIDRTIL